MRSSTLLCVPTELPGDAGRPQASGTSTRGPESSWHGVTPALPLISCSPHTHPIWWWLGVCEPQPPLLFTGAGGNDVPLTESGKEYLNLCTWPLRTMEGRRRRRAEGHQAPGTPPLYSAWPQRTKCGLLYLTFGQADPEITLPFATPSNGCWAQAEEGILLASQGPFHGLCPPSSLPNSSFKALALKLHHPQPLP